MLRIDVYASPERADEVVGALADVRGVRHVTTGGTTHDGLTPISAEVDPTTADLAIDRLGDLGIGPEDLTLWRAPGVQPLGWRRRIGSSDAGLHVGADVVGRADENARLASSYLVFMTAAGIIAGIGVLTGSAVLIVGAMALSPDLLPMSACAIGLVERRWQLAARALRALCIGLAAGMVGACAATVALRLFGQVPDDLILAETTIGDALTSLSPGSLIVALTAGVAGMLAFERPSGAAVGVAISVTTIPAAAYVGAAVAMGRDDPMWGALVVLSSNVAMLVIASTLTLLAERRSRRRRAARLSGPIGSTTA